MVRVSFVLLREARAETEELQQMLHFPMHNLAKTDDTVQHLRRQYRLLAQQITEIKTETKALKRHFQVNVSTVSELRGDHRDASITLEELEDRLRQAEQLLTHTIVRPDISWRSLLEYESPLKKLKKLLWLCSFELACENPGAFGQTHKPQLLHDQY